MADDFVPALGKHEFTGDYDRVIAVMTRERKWRGAFIDLIAPNDDDVIVDVGAGTGTLAIALKHRAPKARIIGVDPDDAVLDIARRKAQEAGVSIEWIQAMGDQTAARLGSAVATKAVSSLVFHQCLPDAKLKILTSMRQRTLLMRLLFRQVQMLDGWAHTTPNAKGELPAYMSRAGFADVNEVRVISTPTGSISLYQAVTPEGVA